MLAADPVRHTSVLSLVGQLMRDIRPTEAEPIMLTVQADGALRGAVLCTPPMPANVSALPGDLAPVVVRHLVANGQQVSGARGPEVEVDAFAAAWVAVTGDDWKITMDDFLYRLEVLVPPVGVPGEFRLVAEEDVPLVVQWRTAFEGEAMARQTDPDSAEIMVRRTIASGACYGLWCVDGRPVAVASASAPVEAMSRIGAVYTPPAERGHGYGSAVTAGVSQWALDRGVTDVVLHADRDNPVSNAIYQRMGYRQAENGRTIAFGSRK
jgi:RimJ/RimL family protein N-acetyltransferase